MLFIQRNDIVQQRRPYFSRSPDLAGFTYRFNGGFGDYHALQLKMEKRFSAGFSMVAAYTASKNLVRGLLGPINPFNYMVKGLNGIDVPQRLVFNYIYELPFGRGRWRGSNWNRATDALFGGWQVAGITNLQSGFPFTPSITSNLDNGQGNRPDRICDGRLSNPNIDRWFDTRCFAAPAVNVIGNSGFNVLRGPSFDTWDITVGKNFKFTESRRIEFRADFLNAFNEVAFGNPNTRVDAPGGGTISSVVTNTTPRLIQLGLKLYF